VKISCSSKTGYVRELGFVEVETMDEDLGRSGSGLTDRPGFQRLVTEVCEGQVGAAFTWRLSSQAGSLLVFRLGRLSATSYPGA
jgi:hypothetical protein